MYVPQTGTIMRRTNDYLLGKEPPSLTFPLKKSQPSQVSEYNSRGISWIYIFSKINFTYFPLVSIAIDCTGPLWHNILTRGSFVFGAHIVTVPENNNKIP